MAIEYFYTMNALLKHQEMCSFYQELNISTLRDSNDNLLTKLYIYNQSLWFVLSTNQWSIYENIKHNHVVSGSIQYLDKLTFDKPDIHICILFDQFDHLYQFKTHFIAIAKKKTLAS